MAKIHFGVKPDIFKYAQLCLACTISEEIITVLTRYRPIVLELI